MEIPHWFEEGWIDTDAKALGLYMALLYSRFKIVPPRFRFLFRDRIDINREVKAAIANVLTGEEEYEAWKSARLFLSWLYIFQISFRNAEELVRSVEKSITRLENIERNHYSRFRKACYKYFKKECIEDLEEEDKKDLKKMLKCLKMEHFTDISALGSTFTPFFDSSTSFIYKSLTNEGLESLDKNEREKQESRIRNIINALIRSGILWFKEIIPAPFLEDEFVEKLAPPEEETEVEMIRVREEVKDVIAIKEEERRKYEGKTPAKEILESIVADVLKDLGLRVKINEMLKTREGMIEADVWGTKLVGNTRFYVYASCKNWNREVDRNVIFSEVGRISNLIQSPHLKIFIAKKLTESARETALIDGFTVIELGEKAETNNAEEIYNIVYKHLRGLFIEIAPPELQKFAKEAREISERLRTLAEEIERIR